MRTSLEIRPGQNRKRREEKEENQVAMGAKDLIGQLSWPNPKEKRGDRENSSNIGAEQGPISSSNHCWARFEREERIKRKIA